MLYRSSSFGRRGWKWGGGEFGDVYMVSVVPSPSLSLEGGGGGGIFSSFFFLPVSFVAIWCDLVYLYAWSSLL